MKKSTKTETFEVLIVGGGLAGLTMAIALGKAGVNVACLDREAPATQLKAAYDGRTTALSFATQNILKAIGVWKEIEKHAEPIRDIRVTDGDAPNFLHFPFGAVNGQPFGWIIENQVLRAALVKCAGKLKYVTHMAPAAVTAVEYGEDIASVTLKDGQILHTQLVVGADGKDSFCRQQAGIEVRERPYNQTAIVCTIGHSEPHNGLALENFRPNGPFAVLPMTHNRASIVWSDKGELAPHFLKLSEPEFIAELKSRIGDWLGDISLVSGRFAYPLNLLHAKKYTGTRLALISEAAHRMHPIAGQGLNVGMRDVALLAELIVDAVRQGQDAGSPALLKAYERGRKPDTFAMLAGTDVLTHLFSNAHPALRRARRLGLSAVQRTTHTKGFFMRYAMGLTGPKQRLLAGQPL